MNVLHAPIARLLYNTVQYAGGPDFGERGTLPLHYFSYSYFFMLNHIDAINKPKNEKNKQTNWRNNVFGKKKREREKKKGTK